MRQFEILDARSQDAARHPRNEAGLTDRLWNMEDVAELFEAAAPKPGRPATYKKRETIADTP